MKFELGDIIELNNETRAFIKYIDSKQLELILENKEEILINIVDGIIKDNDINSISLLSRSEKKGYAKQNDLIENKWIDIYFGGDIPFTLTGIITRQERDVIEIKLINNEIIYIDFEYKGIPKHYKIEKIQKRSPPNDKYIQEEKEEVDVEVEEYDIFNQMFEGEQEEIVQVFEVNEQDRKYHILSQKEDLLDDILSKVPTSKRTIDLKYKSNQIVNRFEELYNEYIHDDKITKIDENLIPIERDLIDNKKPEWIIPIVNNIRNIYTYEGDKFDSDREDIILISENVNNLMEEEVYKTNVQHLCNEKEIYGKALVDNFDNMLSSCVSTNESQLILNTKELQHVNYNEVMNVIGYSVLPKVYTDIHEKTESLNMISKKSILNNKYLDTWKLNEYQETDELFLDDSISLHYINNCNEHLDIFPDVNKSIDIVLETLNPTDFLSFHNIYEYLAKVSVYKNDLHINNTNNLIKKLTSFQKYYERKNNEKIKTKKIKDITFRNETTSLLGKYSDIILENYKIQNNASDEEMYSIFLYVDNNHLYTSIISQNDIDLFTNVNIREIIEKKLNELEEKQKENTKQCDEIKLVKQYVALDELESDNGVDNIYVDKKYDDTRYEIIDEFKKQEETMSIEELKEFLIKHLLNNVGMNQKQANEEADALILKKRKVYEGDYAVLEENDNVTYFRRENNIWKIDETKSIENEREYFCNSRRPCFQLKDECLSTESTILNIETQNTNDILKNVINEEQITIEQIKHFIQDNFNFALNNINTKLRMLNNFKYDKLKSKLSLTDNEIIETSPYEYLKNKILSLPFQRKFLILDKFITTLIGNEDDTWLYCIKTNLKLLPSYYKKLVHAYKVGNYDIEVNNICRDIGTISDNGDRWVDKRTGYTIKMIQFETNHINHSVIEKEVEYVSISKDKLFIQNIVSYLLNYFPIRNQEKYIVDDVLRLSKKMVNTLQEFKNKFPDEKNIEKKYENHKIQTIIPIAGLYVLIYVQTHIPSINTKITFPNCKFSLGGFPLDPKGNKKGLDYIACILKAGSKTYSDYWNVFKNKDTKFISNAMYSIYKFIKDDVKIKEKMKNKQNEIVNKVNEYEPWLSFLPIPEVESIEKIIPLDNKYYTTIDNLINKSDKKQQLYLDMLDIKIKNYSYFIQYVLQKKINKESILIEYNNFVQNTCCMNLLQKPNNMIQYLSLDVINNAINTINVLKQKQKMYKYNPSFILSNENASQQLVTKTIDEIKINITKFNKISIKNVELNTWKDLLYNILEKEGNNLDENIESVLYDIVENKDIDEIKKYIMSYNFEKTESINEFIRNYSFDNVKIKTFLLSIHNIETISSTLFLNSKESTTVNLITFLKQCICKITRDDSMQTQESYVFIEKYVPQHWNLSKQHVKDVQNILHDEHDNFSTNAFLKKVYTNNLMNKLHCIQKITKILPYVWIKYTDFLIELHKFLFIYSINSVIDNISYIDMNEAYEESENDFNDDEIIQEQLLKNISLFLISSLEKCMVHFQRININEKKLKDRNVKLRTDEKERKIQFLESLDPDKRKIQKYLKQAKLGDWSIGLQKGFREYDASFYDREREALINEMNMYKDQDLSMANMELYDNDQYNELLAQREEDIERNDMFNDDNDGNIEDN